MFGAGLPDDLFSKQNPNLVQFLRALDWKILKHFMAIWNIFRTLYIFTGFGIMDPEKSGNPGLVYSSFLKKHVTHV
jgi:hypothetical protein